MPFRKAGGSVVDGIVLDEGVLERSWPARRSNAFDYLGDVIPKGFEDTAKLWEVRWQEQT